MHTLFEGAALAVIVVFLFLRDFRATIIAAITLPLSILPSFWAMEQLGFSLNLVSLLAITLSTGILVDDAIVEIENIVRHIRMGKSPYQAALEAADEIGLAVIAISLTIVAVFAPASFMTLGGRPVLQAVRHHGLGAGAVLAAVRAPDHADARRLFPASRTRTRRRSPGASCGSTPRSSPGRCGIAIITVVIGLAAVRRLDLEHQAAAVRLPARAGHGALAARDRAAVRLAAHRHRDSSPRASRHG